MVPREPVLRLNCQQSLYAPALPAGMPGNWGNPVQAAGMLRLLWCGIWVLSPLLVIRRGISGLSGDCGSITLRSGGSGGLIRKGCVANNVNVTNRGFEYLAQMMAGNIAQYSIPTFIGWGGANSYNAAATVLPATAPSQTQGTGQWSDVGPYQEFAESRTLATKSVTSNTAAAGTVSSQYVGTITSLSGQSVGESFLTPSGVKPAVFIVTTSNVTAGAAALTVNTSGALAGQYYQMNNEVILISSTAASNVWNITRGQNGSTANTAKTGDVLTFGNIPGAGASNPSSGDMFAHAGFQALVLNTNDSVAFTWTVSVTS